MHTQFPCPEIHTDRSETVIEVVLREGVTVGQSVIRECPRCLRTWVGGTDALGTELPRETAKVRRNRMISALNRTAK